ncbi:protoporphyrinogen oxidase HemJ [Legionella yabuuchiae]|uniref:protoporphyrinogen oxidase HemJ n=1 Tax=Legionella yabuuchiae TaxID=376727 RepID=UPI00105565C0|nr:protoporphyrinogen oxidase HemJ [Legionella yabuuchiae]
MLYLKAFHIIAMVAWFAGLFYLPRLFVYHCQTHDDVGLERFKIMEKRLYYGIMWPAGLLTTALGISLLLYNPSYYLRAGWMHTKLLLVILLWGYHLTCGLYRKHFLTRSCPHSSRYFRLFNEIPTFFLILIVLLVVVKPF